MNGGNFKGYDKVLPKTNPTSNEIIPTLYKEGRYPEILQYIKDESKDFLTTYQILKREMPKLRSNLR